MAELKILYDREGKTLTVWFTDPSREHVCEETGAEVVLMKGRVVFETAPAYRSQP